MCPGSGSCLSLACPRPIPSPLLSLLLVPWAHLLSFHYLPLLLPPPLYISWIGIRTDCFAILSPTVNGDGTLVLTRQRTRWPPRRGGEGLLQPRQPASPMLPAFGGEGSVAHPARSTALKAQTRLVSLDCTEWPCCAPQASSPGRLHTGRRRRRKRPSTQSLRLTLLAKLGWRATYTAGNSRPQSR